MIEIVHIPSLSTPQYKLYTLSVRKPIGQLVLLGFDIAAFTPIAYQRSHLLRPSREI